MLTNWSECKHVLCVRPDNMGDLLMSTPAFRALKETLNCKITVLTSSMAAGIARHIPVIDEVMVYDVPWVKSSSGNMADWSMLVADLRERQFDGAIVFSVYSQNPMPSIMLTYLAGIPLRLAYCRENPYELLTNWVPDKEPYLFIQHQVRRDLRLVATIGATTSDERLVLQPDERIYASLVEKLTAEGINRSAPWMVLHAGVSEEKRKYPEPYWIKAAQRIRDELGFQLLCTGAASEQALTSRLVKEIGASACSLAGKLTLEEFILLLRDAPLVVSVNTGTTHICAAVGTPVIVLYALTNPQHAPWKVGGRLLTFDIPEDMRSNNEVIRFVHEQMQPRKVPMVLPEDILYAVRQVLIERDTQLIPEMIPLHHFTHKML